MPDPLTSSGELDKLATMVSDLRNRLKELDALFVDIPVNPLNSAEFKKFLEDHLSVFAMRYALTGKIEQLTPEDDFVGREEVAKALGFAVGPAPSVTGKLDPALLNNPVAMAALAAGANLTEDDDD